ncbi:hypothetical protein KRE47_14460 [Elizabethkingia meningoseptica]|uniref:DUF2231 domain-containing protein n=1 Tax=Elizabethkingia meningoseptica TaxID=238 RepID=UPI0022F1932E|nr:DUF2231 domain-containing protein [Elizabethkingia meningoseptica]EJK5328449.1 hypothetical protein [Elizabethkingia meningoseptica]MDE5468240.1 hypothetical protein [Elizabethkingia meningoseptica]MDE5475707.1 hypothetical protein [Elizabethkingia meningoseptica]MDE5479583.1 hypothetical protein [Elizabethkingia meningoseptica]MDE5485440.1 hypothetical protein [Elizabethkingia meningoseptica]
MFDLFEGFPNIHPMIVHFPIVLLLLALVTQIATLVFKSNLKALNTVTLFFLITGTIGSLIAIQTAPHISGDANVEAFEVFERHRKFAIFTFWTALGVSALHFIFIKWYYRKWNNFIITLLLIILSSFVFITGHNGAKLVYIHDIGPKGNGVLSE